MEKEGKKGVKKGTSGIKHSKLRDRDEVEKRKEEMLP